MEPAGARRPGLGIVRELARVGPLALERLIAGASIHVRPELTGDTALADRLGGFRWDRLTSFRHEACQAWRCRIAERVRRGVGRRGVVFDRCLGCYWRIDLRLRRRSTTLSVTLSITLSRVRLLQLEERLALPHLLLTVGRDQVGALLALGQALLDLLARPPCKWAVGQIDLIRRPTVRRAARCRRASSIAIAHRHGLVQILIGRTTRRTTRRACERLPRWSERAILSRLGGWRLLSWRLLSWRLLSSAHTDLRFRPTSRCLGCYRRIDLRLRRRRIITLSIILRVTLSVTLPLILPLALLRLLQRESGRLVEGVILRIEPWLQLRERLIHLRLLLLLLRVPAAGVVVPLHEQRLIGIQRRR